MVVSGATSENDGWLIFRRKQYVCTLVNDYGFSLDQMDEEIRLPLGRGSVRADLAVWRTPQDKPDRKTPLIVVECKADNVTIKSKRLWAR
jgi:type I restriction enzyme M protein